MSVVKSPRDILTNYYDLLTYVIDGQLGALASDVLHVITLHEPLTLFEIAIKVKEQNATLSKDAFAQKVNAVETNIGTASSTFVKTSHTSYNNHHNIIKDNNYNNNNNNIKGTKDEDDFTHLLTDVAIKEVMTRLLLHRCVSYHRVERTYKINRFASLFLRIAYPLVYHLAYKEFGVIGHTIITNLHQLAVLPFDVLMSIVHKQITVEPSLTDQLHKEHEHQQIKKSNHINCSNENFKGKNGRNEKLCIEEVNHVGRKLLERGWIELLDPTHHASHDNYKETAVTTNSSSSNVHKRNREDNALEHSNIEEVHSINLTIPLSTPCQLNVFQIKLHFMEESIVEMISEYYERESTHSGLHCAIIRVFFDALRTNLQERQRKRRFESKEKKEYYNEYTECLNNQDNIDNNDEAVNDDNDVCKDTIEFPVLSIEYIQDALKRKLGNVFISQEAIYNTLMQLYNTEHNCLQTFHGALQIDKNTNQIVLRANAFGILHDDNNMIRDSFTENALDSSTMDTNNNNNNINSNTGTGSKRGKAKEASSKKGKEHKRVTFQNAQRALQSNSPQNIMEKCELEKQRRLIGIVRRSSTSYLHDHTSTSPALFNHENYNYNNNSSEFDFESELALNMHYSNNKNEDQNISHWQSQRFTLNASALINCLQAQVIERVIFARYGILGIRIAKLLFAQYRWLEDKHIAEELIATLSHVREVLHGMLNDGYCLQQEVPRSSNVNERMIRSSVFLWGNESVKRIIPFICEHIAKSLHNALVKLHTLTENRNQINGTASSTINSSVIPTNVSIRLPEMNKLLSSQSNNKAEAKVSSQVMERVIHQQRQVTSLQSCALSLIRMLLIMNL